MSLSRNIPGFLVAATVGIVSGYYIFDPIVRQEVESGRPAAEAAAKAQENAKALEELQKHHEKMDDKVKRAIKDAEH
ncbi:hypothetical protein PYCC9005_003536 [Savitreella phatthalungensis]